MLALSQWNTIRHTLHYHNTKWAKLVETVAPLLRLGDPVQNALENILFRQMLADLQIQHDFTGIANAAVTCLGE